MTKQQHELYTAADFTREEYARRNVIAVLVIDGGIGICKKCGAGEIELVEHTTCTDYKLSKKERACRNW